MNGVHVDVARHPPRKRKAVALDAPAIVPRKAAAASTSGERDEAAAEVAVTDPPAKAGQRNESRARQRSRTATG